jgi:hypothetical protein
MNITRSHFICLAFATAFVWNTAVVRSAWADDKTPAEKPASKTGSKKSADAKQSTQEKTASKESGKSKTDSKDSGKSTTDSKPAAESDEDMKLHGGEDGTIFKSLRIEGEDRVRIEFDRPSLNVDLDLRDAPGLEWEGIHTVLNKRDLDLISPYLDRTSTERPPYFARPWLDGFSSDAVARFRPALEGVERWRLVVANSQGKTVKSFDGKGKPPKEIVWDGRSSAGKPVPPGLTYSYVLEAYDRAGNKRNFVGDGFELPSYRVSTADGYAMLFAGGQLVVSRSEEAGGTAPAPAILLEAASWINQSTDKPVRVEVTARTFDHAKRLAADIEQTLKPLLIGDPLRVQSVTNVVPDAPDQGTIAITVMSKVRLDSANSTKRGSAAE